VEGPNIAYFYQNLGRIVQKEWWLYDETDTLDEYEQKGTEDEEAYHKHLAVLLCYDYVSYEEANDVSVREAFPQLTSWLLELARTFGSGTVMSAERFLENCSLNCNDYVAHRLPCAREKEKFRRQVKTLFKAELREKWHK